MWCEQQFAQFNERLMLDRERAARIASAVKTFGDFCQEDSQLRAAMAEPPFLQGSVSTHTAVKPLRGDEFDVDVIYSFRLSAFAEADRRPMPLFNWFVSRLQTREFYRARLLRKTRCVRINYAGDFHVDIIPSTREASGHQPYAVPARDLSDWVTNDPIGFAQWVRHCDAAAGVVDRNGDGPFTRSVRSLKRWRDHFFGEDSAISSLLLTTILGKHEASRQTYNPPLSDPLYPKYKTDAAYLYDLMRLTHGCLVRPTPGAFMHPTIKDEDLSRNWDRKYLLLFLHRLATCIDHVRKGLYAQSDAESRAHFRRGLGESFPID
jgi:hypothetical protein